MTDTHVERARALLDARPHAAITIVRAPWGYGKSTLLDAWRSESRVPTVSVTGTEAGKDRAGFWQSIADELPRDIGETAGFDDPHGVATDVDRMLVRVARSAPLRVCVDRFESFEDRAALADDLCRLVGMSAQVQVLVVTRTESSLESSRTRLHVPVRVIRAEDLTLTSAEVAAEARRCGITEPRLVSMVEAVTAGVPVLVRYASLELARSVRLPELAPLREWLALRVDQFVEEEVRRRGATEVEALVAADCLDAELAEALTGRPGQELLARLEQHGLGVWNDPVVGDHRTTRVFHLSASVLRAVRRVVSERDSSRYRQQRRQFAEWARMRSMPKLAFQAAVQSGDGALASEILTESWWEVSEELDVLIDVLGRLPRGDLARWPLLAGGLAVAYSFTVRNHLRSAETFALALSSLRRQHGPRTTVDRILFTLIEMMAARTAFGSFPQAQSAANRLEHIVTELSAVESDRLRRTLPHVIAEIAATYLYAGNTRSALTTLLKLHAAERNDGASLRARHYLTSIRATAHAVAGELEQAGRFLELAQSNHRENTLESNVSGPLSRVARGYLALEAGRFTEAVDLTRSTDLEDENVEHVHLLLEVETWGRIGIDPAQALDRVLEVRAAVVRRRSPSKYVVAHIDRSAARAALATGRSALAARYARRAGALGAVPHALLLAKAELARRADESALGVLLRHPLDETATRRDALDYDLALATAYLRNGHRDGALAVVRRVRARLQSGLRVPLLAHASLGYRELQDFARNELLELPELSVTISAIAPGHSGPLTSLTPRELAVLRELSGEGGYAEIAERLCVSINTVRSQVRSVYKKLGVNKRDDALAAALSLHLLDEVGHEAR